ncbi:MAG: LLM class F420-dependent oxidoreductase [Acidimicrobiales bacterium]
MPTNPVLFGAFVPHGRKMNFATSQGAAAQWARAAEIASLAEVLGYDSVWIYDQFDNAPGPHHEAVLECWTMLAALSQRTTNVRLGQIVCCSSCPHPSLLAKITSTLDVLSGGRLEWGVGPGWYDGGYRADGDDVPEAEDQLGKLTECVEIVKAMWSHPETTYEGRFYRVTGAHCDPKPVQQPHPPIFIGGGGEEVTLRIAARLADRSHFGGGLETFSRKCEILKKHCAGVGRDYDSITKTVAGEVFIRETEAELRAEAQPSGGQAFDPWARANLVGTPEQVATKVEAHLRAGAGGFIPWCSDYPADTTLRLLAEQVMPAFR